MGVCYKTSSKGKRKIYKLRDGAGRISSILMLRKRIVILQADGQHRG